MKACPFCGGKASIVEWTECIGHGDYIKVSAGVCEKCHAVGPKKDTWSYPETELKKLAKEAWEKRREQHDQE